MNKRKNKKYWNLNGSLIIAVTYFICLMSDVIKDVGKTLPASVIHWKDVVMIALFMITFFALGYATRIDQVSLREKDPQKKEYDFED